MPEGRGHVADLDKLIAEILTDAYGEQEQFWAFRQAIEDEVVLPTDSFVIGNLVSLLEIDYDGNALRGLTARCRRDDGSEHIVAAADVAATEGSIAGLYLEAYRRWLGLDPLRAEAGPDQRPRTTPGDLAEGVPVELVVLSVAQRAVPCRVQGSEQLVDLRARRLWDLVPGEIAVVETRRQWRFGGHSYLSGEILSTRLNAACLGVEPLGLEDRSVWDPADHYWGEQGDPIEAWAKPIVARGPRRAFEMEQVLPGAVSEDPFFDPISEAVDLKDAGSYEEYEKRLMALCRFDLRCLDAHAHLGNQDFDSRPRKAIRHYEVGVRIGELSLGDGFDGLLPWGHLDNRPFLRCLHGYGLCLWRLGRFCEAAQVFDRMLWLNPSDNQGARFLLDEVKAGTAWEREEVG